MENHQLRFHEHAGVRLPLCHGHPLLLWHSVHSWVIEQNDYSASFHLILIMILFTCQAHREQQRDHSHHLHGLHSDPLRATLPLLLPLAETESHRYS